MKQFLRGFSIYLPSYPKALVYMLQSTEYQIGPYLAWVRRTSDFSNVMNRRQLDKTRAAKLLLLALQVGIGLQLLIGLLLVCLGFHGSITGGQAFGAGVVLSYPFVWAYLLVVPLLAGRYLLSNPKNKLAIEESAVIFASHPGAKIAVAGSYGKTTLKELLATVLGEGLDVAVTPANKNVSSSHAQFAKKLSGNEDVLVIEYGEGEPGDVERFAKITHPTHAIITGLAPAHLNHYKTLRAAGEDIFSVADYLRGENVFVNADSTETKAFIKKGYHEFNVHGALGWKATDIKTSLEGTSFTLKKGKQTLKLKSELLGKHQVGYLSLVAALGLEFGLNTKQVQAGVAKTRPFEHRMQPYQLGGAWIIDDTYNGNLEGIRAGTQLLHDLRAGRKIYVTPGLVDQGEENQRVHREMGKLIAGAQPDLVVLMQNSVTDFIKSGLEQGNYQGELQIETNPLEFYTNLQHFVASGDLVLMQNDWPDNYA
ncbi:MAG TPA: Mur ligase family protein [Candidatus Saccharimonadales bacterium]|nr:Mur ligase family protein [Candidatus Saccharimonadales bacterium]